MKFINIFWIASIWICFYPIGASADHSSGGNFTSVQPGLQFNSTMHSLELVYQRRWLNFQESESKNINSYNYPGIIQQFQNGQSGHGHQHGYDNSYYQEYRNDIELRGNVFWHEKSSISFNIPYRQIQLFEDGQDIDAISGIGDPVLMVNYFPIDFTGVKRKNDFGHRLSFGGGVKVPFGKFSTRNYNNEITPAYQPGSGSFDFLFYSSYLITYKKLGWFNYYSYRLNTQNPNGFKFSNTMNFRSNMFLSLQKKSSNFIPFVSFEMQKAGADRLYNQEFDEDSGGILLLSGIGMEYFFKNYGLSVEYAYPFAQKVQGEQFKYQHQFQAGIKFLINKQN
ncbi:MAG: hypothetical protein WD048_07790 [Chitinophagales bacterium]